MNGLLIQWGSVSQDKETLLIRFSTSYTSEKTYVIVALKNSGTGVGDSDNDVRVYNKSECSCEFYSSRKLPVEWIAIGYQLNGLLIQWGSVTASISKTDYKDFPTSFSSKNSWFAATQSNQSESSVALGKMLKGTSGANFLPWARSGSNNYSDTFEYIAIGYQLNGLLIQWGKVKSASGKASVSFRAYSSRESYAIFVAEGVQDCETRTTQDDTNGYDYGAGIDQKYESSCIFSCQSNRNIFYLAIGYQLNGLLIQWGIELVDKNKRYNDITYNAYSLPPIVLLSATRSATRWESAGFVGAINITKNGFRASYGEYQQATNIEKYTWLAIGQSA